MQMTCPNCCAELTVQHLRDHPLCLQAAKRFVSLYSLAKRVEWPPKAGPGRPRKLPAVEQK
jgi:predicted amidophosphoribosyltransferase